MTTQIAVRIPSEMLAKLDEVVGRGRVANRTEAVRAAIEAWLREEEEQVIAEEYRRAYAEHPQDPAFVGSATCLARETWPEW